MEMAKDNPAYLAAVREGRLARLRGEPTSVRPYTWANNGALCGAWLWGWECELTLSDQQLEVLRNIERAQETGRWVVDGLRYATPRQFGAVAGSFHASTSVHLALRGLVDRKKVTSGPQGRFGCRLTDDGLAVLHSG